MLTAFVLYDCLKNFGNPGIDEMMILKRICEKWSAREWNGADSLGTVTGSVEYSRHLIRDSKKRVQPAKRNYNIHSSDNDDLSWIHKVRTKPRCVRIQ